MGALVGRGHDGLVEGMGMELASGSDGLEQFAGRLLVFFKDSLWKLSGAGAVGNVEGWLIGYRACCKGFGGRR